MSAAPEPAPEPAPKAAPEALKATVRRGRWRLVALALVTVALIAAARVTGLGKQLGADALRDSMRAAGPWGVALFAGAFTLGVLVHVPGTLFVAAAVLVYGRAEGYFVALAGAFPAVCASFAVVRAIGGQPLSEVRSRWLAAVFAQLDRRPILAVFVLRSLLFVSPPLNTVLGLTRVRFRDFAVGSAFGLIAPMAVVVFALDQLMRLPAAARFAHWLLG